MLSSLILLIAMTSKITTVIVNRRGMITIPAALREKYGIYEGSRVAFVEIDGKIEFIPIRSIEEMESACTASLEESSKIYDENKDLELKLENEDEGNLH